MRVQPSWQHGGLHLRPLCLQGECYWRAVRQVGVRRTFRTTVWHVLHLPDSYIPGRCTCPSRHPSLAMTLNCAMAVLHSCH